MTQEQQSSSSSYTVVRNTIIAFSITIFLLFVVILSISVIQYQHFKIVDGNAVCEEFFNRCVLSFEYDDGKGNLHKKTSIIGYKEINQDGIFSVKVAYRLDADGKLGEYFILGSPYHVFLGTKNMVIIYSILSIFSLLICISFIPFTSYKKKRA